MEEMLNNRRHKKLTKKLPKGQTTSPRDGTNFEKALAEKMEQHNWTLLIACKICKKKKKNAQSLMQTISNLFHVVVQMINHLTLQITLTDLRSRHKCHSSDLILKNNHGNPNSGELYYSHRSGQPNCDDTIFRGSHIEKWTPTQVLFCFSVNFAKYLRITCLQNTSARLPLYFIEGRKTCFSL